MRDSDRRAKLNRALINLQAVLADESLVARLRESTGGYPSTQYGRLTSRSHESPVEAQAGKKDPARADLDLLDALVKRVSDCTDGLDDLRRRWPKKRPGTVDRSDEPGCEICAREKRWSPPSGDPSDLGMLPRAFLLCAICRKMVLNLGKLPRQHEYVEAHTKGFVKMRSAK